MTVKLWLERLQHLEVQDIATASGRVAYRQAGGGAAITHVLLHGIGSSSANWLAQLEAASGNPALRVLAWDAPGYSRSAALPMDTPTATDYAQRLWVWLDAVAAQDAQRDDRRGAQIHAAPAPITLVGHSLGCLMAASAAQQWPQRVSQLILMSPAQGYAQALPAERDKKLQDRLDLLARLGPAGMAQLRGAAMLAPDAHADHVALVQHIMAQIDPHGYAQAARMLAGGDLLSDLSRYAAHAAPAGQAAPSARPIIVASGSADTITPPAGCQQVAAHINAPYISLGAVGHACAIEAADEVTRLIGLTVPASASGMTAAASKVPAATLAKHNARGIA